MYPPELVAPMKEELTSVGFEDFDCLWCSQINKIVAAGEVSHGNPQHNFLLKELNKKKKSWIDLGSQVRLCISTIYIKTISKVYNRTT